MPDEPIAPTPQVAPAQAAPTAPFVAGRVPAWRFWLPLLCQLAIVAAVPAPKVWAHATGTTVLLRTTPVDPYDVLRGRYMRLGFADAGFDGLAKLPGWRPELGEAGHDVWVEFAPAPAGKPWKPVAVHGASPTALPPGHVAIRGPAEGGTLDWGMEQYFIPEGAGDGMEAAMRAAARESILVEARVDARGTAVLEGLWVAGRKY